MISIEKRCKCQQSIADKIFMDFKYTHPGSTEQINALSTFNISVAMWSIFLKSNHLLIEEDELESVSSQLLFKKV